MNNDIIHKADYDISLILLFNILAPPNRDALLGYLALSQENLSVVSRVARFSNKKSQFG
jgi:hypothetical protein